MGIDLSEIVLVLLVQLIAVAQELLKRDRTAGHGLQDVEIAPGGRHPTIDATQEGSRCRICLLLESYKHKHNKLSNRNSNPNLITKHTNGDGRAGEGKGEELGVGVELLAHRRHRLAELPDLLLHHHRRLLLLLFFFSPPASRSVGARESGIGGKM